ncbi:MAG: hypothetical protein ACI8XB_003091, partial [Patiriisocius sp.]
DCVVIKNTDKLNSVIYQNRLVLEQISFRIIFG